MSDAQYAAEVQLVSAKIFLDAKLLEFDAACYGGSQARVTECEENCRSALQSLLDLKAKNAVTIMIRHRSANGNSK